MSKMPAIRILLVADGIFNFGGSEDDTYFTLDFLVNTALRGNIGQEILVDTAHRSGDPKATITTPFNFATTVQLAAYDEIWLFGYAGSNGRPSKLVFISDDELAAIAVFMDNGGGVFATGDHGGLGSLMCGRIPRVRSMRKWFDLQDTDSSIPVSAPRNWPGLSTPTISRADTLVPDKNNSWNFDNQSDDRPQQLTLPGGVAHPVLQGSSGPINAFPDHMHEGEVLGFGGVSGRTPWTLNDKLTFGTSTFTEYPTANGHQEVPTVIATGKITGGHATSIEPTDRACESANFLPDLTLTVQNEINILSVYDGHTVGVGRVVADSSFHHYLDLNLTGDSCATAEKTLGFRTPAGQPYLLAMQEFYVNLAKWLAGPPVTALTCLTGDGANAKVYYIQGDKLIMQASWDPSSSLWRKEVLPANPVREGSTLASMAVGGNNDIRLYYVDTSFHVNELTWNGVSWHNSVLPSQVVGENSPLSCLFIGIDSRVYYFDAENQINELAWSGDIDEWSNALLPSNTVRPSSPTTCFAVNGTDPRVYYFDAEGNVNELAWVGSWVNNILPVNSLVGASHPDSGIACFGANGHDSRVYYINASLNSLSFFNWVSDHWENGLISLPGPAGPIETSLQAGALACYGQNGTVPHVFFVGQQNEVTEVEANPAIATGWGFGPFISEVQVRQASVIALVAFGGGPAVQLFFIGEDGRLYTAKWDGSTWTSGLV